VTGPISYGNSENYHLFLKQLTGLYEKKETGNKVRSQMQTKKNCIIFNERKLYPKESHLLY